MTEVNRLIPGGAPVATPRVIADIIRREGAKYTNYPEDRGGPTKYGVTLATLRAVRGNDVTAHDVAALTEDEAVAIYERVYIKPFEQYERFPDLHDLIVDAAVNHGVGRAKQWLKEIGLTDYDSLYKEFLKKRVQFYGRIITDRPANAKFAAGWANRVSEFIR
jgi:Glycosyl hydrolase 108